MNSATGSNTSREDSTKTSPIRGHWFGDGEVAGEGPVGVAMKGFHLDPMSMARNMAMNVLERVGTCWD